MIRCIPVDGSPPFEVEDAICEASYVSHEEPDRGLLRWYTTTVSTSALGPNNVVKVDGRACRIESWRERAERFEQALREIAEQDANTCRPGWKHWATRAADALGIPVPW